MAVPATGASSFRIQRMLMFLRRFWWVPVVTLSLSLMAAVAYLIWAPPTFVSTARMWETEKLRLPDGAIFSEDPQNYLGTQTELVRSEKLRQLALARLRVAGTNNI